MGSLHHAPLPKGAARTPELGGRRLGEDFLRTRTASHAFPKIGADQPFFAFLSITSGRTRQEDVPRTAPSVRHGVSLAANTYTPRLGGSTTTSATTGNLSTSSPSDQSSSVVKNVGQGGMRERRRAGRKKLFAEEGPTHKIDGNPKFGQLGGGNQFWKQAYIPLDCYRIVGNARNATADIASFRPLRRHHGYGGRLLVLNPAGLDEELSRSGGGGRPTDPPGQDGHSGRGES